MLIKHEAGQSILEIIMAVAILVILASSAVITLLGSFTTTTLGQQQTRATFLASQGLAAVESLANQDFLNLANGIYGLENNNNSWQLISESAPIEDLYTRSVTIQDGPITDSKQVISVVKWKTGLVKENQVELRAVFTNWQEGKRSEPVLTPEPTPVVNSCSAYCLSLGSYTTGDCRQNSNRCAQFAQTYEAGGDLYCTIGGLSSCCCGN